MLQSVDIRNFQSLGHVSLGLSRFTVIVGASSSGKSAFTRAVRTLTSNARGNAFITHGERICTIQAVTDKGIVTLKRGRGTEDNEYVLTPLDISDGMQKTFTKLGGSVPEEVSEFIGITAKDPVNYAAQFDRPYLLDDTGAEVARVLGALTNVNVIFEAARESNRRKLALSSTLRTRQIDLDTITAKADQYRGLKAQVAAIGEAEAALTRAFDLQHDRATVLSLLDAVDVAEGAIERFRGLLDIEVPSPDRIIEIAARIAALTSVLFAVAAESARIRDQATAIAQADAVLIEAEETYVQALRDAGTCPTCGQETTHLEGAHSHGID